MERELWKILSRRITQLDRQVPRRTRLHSVGRIVRVYLWAVLHDRPVYWACDRRNWAGVRPPIALPDQSTMSRRLRQLDTQQMLTRLMESFDDDEDQRVLRSLDGKPLPISKHSVDAQATFGRGAGGKDRGYKMHAIYAHSNRPLAWCIRPLNENEHHVAVELIDERVGPGYLGADGNYDANHLYDHTGQRGVTLVTPRRYARAKGLGHHRHSPHRRKAIQRLQDPGDIVHAVLRSRRHVELRFAHLTNFGGGLTCLPPWVRGQHRVQLWVCGKLLIRLARDEVKRKNVA